MKQKGIIVILVIIQLTLVGSSFGLLFAIEVEEEDFADYVNIAGKNRFYTAIALHEMDEYSSGVIGKEELDSVFEEFQSNILLLRNGGEFLGHEIKPLPERYSQDLDKVQEHFVEFRTLLHDFEELEEAGNDASQMFNMDHEIIEVKLLSSTEELTNKLTLELDNSIQHRESLELFLPILNGVVYVATIYVIFRIFKQESKHMQKLEKLYTIGQMASRLAHDLKNPLTVIKGNLDFLTQITSDEKELERYNRMQGSIRDMFHIMDDVLEFARAKELNLTNQKLSKILSDSISSINIPEKVTINLPKEDVELRCDVRKLQAIFVNLFVNSFEAMDKKGTLTVKLDNELEKVKIHVIDSGPGIPDDIISKIFEPLFTSKSTGTGLGLGISKTIVEQHNGKLSVSNNPTTFTIELPKTDN